MVYMCSKKILCDQNDLDIWPTNIIQDHCIFFHQRHHMGQIGAKELKIYSREGYLIYIILVWP